MTLIRIGYAFRIRVNEREKIVYDKLFQHHLSPGQATATQTTWPGLLLCSSCWPLTLSLQKGCLNFIPRTLQSRRAQTRMMLEYVLLPSLLMHWIVQKTGTLFLRWEKDKKNHHNKEVQLFRTPAYELYELCHGKQRQQQALPGSPSKTLPANIALLVYATLHEPYSWFTHKKHQTFLPFHPKMRNSCSL